MFIPHFDEVIYPSPDDPEKNVKKFKVVAKTLLVPFVLYSDFEALKKIRKEPPTRIKYVIQS